METSKLYTQFLHKSNHRRGQEKSLTVTQQLSVQERWCMIFLSYQCSHVELVLVFFREGEAKDT